MTERIQIPLYSLADCSRQLAEITGGQAIEKDHYSTYMVPGNFFYTKHIIFDADEENLDAILAEITKEPRLAISYTEEKVPARIAEVLRSMGYFNPIVQTGMILDIPEDYTYEKDENVQIADPARYLEYSETISTGFGKPKDDQFCEYMTKYANAHCYAYMNEGRIIGAATVLKDKEYPGIHEVTILPEARGKGACTHMIQRLTGDIKAEGYTQVSLQASALGRPVYAAMGFEAVSTIRTWMPVPPQQ